MVWYRYKYRYRQCGIYICPLIPNLALVFAARVELMWILLILWIAADFNYSLKIVILVYFYESECKKSNHKNNNKDNWKLTTMLRTSSTESNLKWDCHII